MRRRPSLIPLGTTTHGPRRVGTVTRGLRGQGSKCMYFCAEWRCMIGLISLQGYLAAICMLYMLYIYWHLSLIHI